MFVYDYKRGFRIMASTHPHFKSLLAIKKIIRIIPVLFISSKVFNYFVEKCFKLSILTPDNDLALGSKLLLNSDIVSVAKK
jgi:hypothetical protein